MSRTPEAGRIARLRFRHLQLLREMRDGRTIRQAAEATHVTQPAVTKALQEIEDIFGCTLFERSRRGLLPTPEGRALLRGAELLLNELRIVGSEVDATARGQIASLRVGAPPFIAMCVVPAVLRELHREHGAGVRVSLLEQTSPRLFEMLCAGELDALITRFPAPQDGIAARRSESLRHERLFDDELLALVPSEHPLARSRSLSMAQLHSERWIVTTTDSSTRRALDDRVRLEGLLPIEPFVESNAAATLLAMVGAGVGIGLWPRIARDFVRASRDVVLVPLDPALVAAPIGLFARGNRAEAAGIGLLRDAIQRARRTIAPRGGPATRGARHA